MVTHGESLRNITRDHALVAALQEDEWDIANLDDKDRALLSFARQLNNSPAKTRPRDFRPLRAAGFTGRNIFDVLLLVALFKYMNRIPGGFRVELDSQQQESYERHLREATKKAVTSDK